MPHFDNNLRAPNAAGLTTNQRARNLRVADEAILLATGGEADS